MLLILVGCGAVGGLLSLGGPPDPGAPDGWGPGDTGTEGLDEAPGAGFPFDAEPGTLFDIALELDAAAIDALERNGPYVPATFEFAGLEMTAGVRYKGSSTFDKLDGKPSFKVNFGTFVPDGRFLGVERLTLNAMKYDPTMLREASAYRLFADMGVPAPRHGYARLTINGAPYGVYSLIETLDENFLDRAFPGDDDGWLYDSSFVAADLTSLGKSAFELQEGDPATAFADLDALVDALGHTDILEVLETRFDVSVFHFLAVDLVSPNWDGYSRNTNNYLLYHAPIADRWSFVPWGQDTAFRGGGMLYAGVRGRVAAACVADSACRERLAVACAEVLTTWEETDLRGYAEGLAVTIAPACEADPRKEGDCEIEKHLEILAERPDDVRSELGP